MKVSFPYMGCVTAYKKLFELLGHEVIMPQKPTQHTIDLGVLNSPEFICFPFKTMMGTYIECCEKGAELIVSSGGSGPCRAGMYGTLHQETLKELGYDVDVIIFDSLFEDFPKFWRTVKKIVNHTPLYKLAHHVLLCYKIVCQMDRLEKQINIKRAYELENGDCNRFWETAVQMYEKCNTFKQLKQVKKETLAMFDAIPVREVAEKDKLRIGIVGEIYVIMESSVNMHMEQRLNDMGVEVYNVQYISDWIKHNIIRPPFNRSKSWKVFRKGRKYKGAQCGGHDMENTGWMIDFAEQGFDGVVHIMPFGCLPELITRSIIPNITQDYGIPVLSMSVDEQTGEANTQTRVEAFVELCRSKKQSASVPISMAVPPETPETVSGKQLAPANR